LLSGFKVTFSETTYNGLDACRQSLGGAGFSSYSGLPELFFVYSPVVTFEGDNTVMTQQSARYLMKNLKNIAKGF